MDLNNIELPAFTVAGLYRSSLIQSGEKTTEIPAEAGVTEKEKIPGQAEAVNENANLQASRKWLGGNLKNILIVVNHTDTIHIPDNELAFLTGILSACKLGLGDIVLLNRNNHQGSSYKELIAQFKSKNVFLFGVEPILLGLPISFPHFQLQTFANTSYLYSPSLQELEHDKLLKSKLWVCLKRIFTI